MMNFKRISVIAAKEVQDHITSQKFLAFLFLMMAITGACVFKGVGSYYNALEEYSLNSILSFGTLPSAMNIFDGIAAGIAGTSIFGSIIAIALGFDLITGERRVWFNKDPALCTHVQGRGDKRKGTW